MKMEKPVFADVLNWLQGSDFFTSDEKDAYGAALASFQWAITRSTRPIHRTALYDSCAHIRSRLFAKVAAMERHAILFHLIAMKTQTSLQLSHAFQ